MIFAKNLWIAKIEKTFVSQIFRIYWLSHSEKNNRNVAKVPSFGKRIAKPANKIYSQFKHIVEQNV